ncbi:MAG: hypothetical protein M3041_00280 [Acidobacteriota bacterium]|nr:hypothetical protein [Acidobacteriota bacterium]
MSRIRLTRRPGQPGTKKLMRQYGQSLICVRYRYDEEMQQRIKTVEIAVERVKWEVQTHKRDDAQIVYFRIEDGEDLLRRAVLHAGGRWNETNGLWRLPRRDASALGLLSRRVRQSTRRAGDSR